MHVLPHTLASLILMRLLFHWGNKERRGNVLCLGHLNALGCWLQDEHASMGGTWQCVAHLCLETLFVLMGLFELLDLPQSRVLSVC